MTPEPPPPPSDGQSLPPRHRPSLDNLQQETTELDLWAFEDDLELGGTSTKPSSIPAPRAAGTDIPAPRERRITKPRESSNPSETSSQPAGEKIQMNINRNRRRDQPSNPPAGLAHPESDFDDLEHWEDLPKGNQIEELPAALADEDETVAAPLVVEKTTEESPVPVVSKFEPEDDEFSPVIRGGNQPVSLQPRLGLSKAERVSLITLLALLAVGGLMVVVYSLNRLPTESAREKSNKFPIKGSMVQVDSANTYWRPPILNGASPEIVRRGTQLLPVLELGFSGGKGAIRVLFRDDQHTAVGDAVTRVVQGSGSVVLPATAGFDDLGMHAAYRTGGSKPWVVEVYEADSATAPGKDFKKLFEMNISTERR